MRLTFAAHVSRSAGGRRELGLVEEAQPAAVRLPAPGRPRHPLDLALIGVAGRLPADLDTLPVVSDRLAAAALPGHPLLAETAAVSLADLAGYPVICMPAGAGIRAALDDACAAQGVRLDVTLEASAPGTVADLAVRGLGVAVLSETMTVAYADRLRSVPIDGPGAPAQLALAWRPAPGPALREFVGHCRRAFTAATVPAVTAGARRGNG
jgi:DNA-binding transcriptional LysR family regulator